MTMNPMEHLTDGADWGAALRNRLFDRRVVLLSGRLDDEVANRVGVELMTLDATGDDPITLQIDSGDGAVAPALALMDVIDLLGVPVHAACVGQVAGPSVGVLAICSRRTVAPHARIRMYEPSVEVHGNARQLQQWVAAHREQWTAFCTRLALVTGRTADELGTDFEAGRYLTAAEAVSYGLADEVAQPEARIHQFPGPPVGFGRR
jgi:ATP-dependent Clp protease protease subunit